MPDCNNCGDCCGPVKARPAEIRKIGELIKRRKVQWVEHDDPLTCGFYQGGLCRVYTVRPAACQLYGVTVEMTCPHFPGSVKMSFPAKAAIASGLMDPNDQTLAEAFAPDGGARMLAAFKDLPDRDVAMHRIRQRELNAGSTARDDAAAGP
jgi:Fe-S-cluster containining protein